MDGFGFRARPNLTHAGHGDPAEHNGRTLLRKSFLTNDNQSNEVDLSNVPAENLKFFLKTGF